MASIIDRARKKLAAHDGVAYDATATRIAVFPAGPDGFPVSLDVLGPREFQVRYDGWHQRFDRAEDAYDCFEYGLSDSCRLRVTLRGETPVAWQIEKREYGLWVPGRRVAARVVPFWRAKRVVHRQNRVFTTARHSHQPDRT